MSKSLLTAGQFAKFARTTKRTVLWYDQKGILKPHHVDESGYRYYAPQQILEFQSVLLMRKLGFSIDEITSLLSEDRSMQRLFEEQRGALEEQIGILQRMLQDTDRYYESLRENGTLVQPKLERITSYDIYYVDRQGPYARIKDYSNELCYMFKTLPEDTVWLTAFMAHSYQPAKADMRIGVVCQPSMQLKVGTEVKRVTVPAYHALTYTHAGSTTLLSLLWQELVKYRHKHHLQNGTGLPFSDVEFYRPDTSPFADVDDSLTTTLHMPVLSSSK